MSCSRALTQALFLSSNRRSAACSAPSSNLRWMSPSACGPLPLEEDGCCSGQRGERETRIDDPDDASDGVVLCVFFVCENECKGSLSIMVAFALPMQAQLNAITPKYFARVRHYACPACVWRKRACVGVPMWLVVLALEMSTTQVGEWRRFPLKHHGSDQDSLRWSSHMCAQKGHVL